MNINIDFSFNFYKFIKKDYHLFEKIAKYTIKLTHLDLFPKIFLECNFISKNKMVMINEQLRKKAEVTDVISECFWENEIKTPMLGVLYICVDRAKKQAKMYQHSLEREIYFLFVHGLLHLLGYDHNNPKEENIMFNLQNEILNHFKIMR